MSSKRPTVTELTNAVTANVYCRPNSETKSSVFLGEKGGTESYLPLMVMMHLMETYGYTEAEIRLECGIETEGYYNMLCDRVEEEVVSRDTRSQFWVKVRLCSSHVRIKRLEERIKSENFNQ